MPEVSPCATVKLRLSPAGGVQAAAGRETWYARSLAVHVAWLGLLSAPLIDRTAASPLGVGLLLAMRMDRVLGMAIPPPDHRSEDRSAAASAARQETSVSDRDALGSARLHSR